MVKCEAASMAKLKCPIDKNVFDTVGVGELDFKIDSVTPPISTFISDNGYFQGGNLLSYSSVSL
jgi:hypothetical protein